ncbi:MAG TPA: hypothetical protein VLA34_08090, partial [Candidatus Krumholzibacterium sp.]|nr:hypothetical protein [Candidatus Krumholzibacterium sp.]
MQRKGPVLVRPGPVISSGFKTSGYGPVHPQRLEIETADLREGAFTLRVVVRDRISGLSAERLASFSIVD